MWISLCLLQGAQVVGTDTYEVLSASKTEGGIRLTLALGTLELSGRLSQDLMACAQALNPDKTSLQQEPHEPSQDP